MTTNKTDKSPNNFSIAFSMTLSTIVANIILAFLGCDKWCLLVTTVLILMANFVLAGFVSEARNLNKVNKRYFSSALRL